MLAKNSTARRLSRKTRVIVNVLREQARSYNFFSSLPVVVIQPFIEHNAKALVLQSPFAKAVRNCLNRSDRRQHLGIVDVVGAIAQLHLFDIR